MSVPLVLPPLEQPVLARRLRRPTDAKIRMIFLFNALLEKGPKLSGPSLQAQLAAVLESGIEDEKDLWERFRERFHRFSVHCGRVFPAAQKQADRWMEEGRWVASWAEGPPPGEGAVACPGVLFGKGTLQANQQWAAVFNSRKPKLVSLQAQWLHTLRHFLDLIASHGLGFAGSLGTLSYDLVCVGAARKEAKLLLFVSQALEALGKAKDSSSAGLAVLPEVALSCLTGAADCPKAVRMVCRDRLLAWISDLHCILEIRAGGNLERILERQGRVQPRPQLRCNLEESGVGRTKARALAAGFLQIPPRLPAMASGRTAEGHAEREGPLFCQLLRADVIAWQAYLYHYTRSCPGPWPGQSYRHYLENLLDAEPLAEHTALAALVRILVEGQLRAGSSIVRGNQGVVSWTSRPPRELDVIRRWNRALIRWTVEPYGLAVKRSVLRRMGARPAIYAASAVYDKLPERERFRFQRHEPPRCSWKSEREWRLPADLKLSDLLPDDAFVFVPTAVDTEILLGCAPALLPFVVLERCAAAASNRDLTNQPLSV